jgi:hypothetical protein
MVWQPMQLFLSHRCLPAIACGVRLSALVCSGTRRMVSNVNSRKMTENPMVPTRKNARAADFESMISPPRP